MTLAYQAMLFAREAHAEQRRKYTNAPYADHLAEVAGITAAVFGTDPLSQIAIATAWLHDCREDQGVTHKELWERFGLPVAVAVGHLSDLEEGNRATRKALSRERLSQAPGWVQTIKCADLISNTSSIVQHDPDFARVYLVEKRELLKVMLNADRRLWNMAWDLAHQEVV